jgi:YebC/PmpR family DNA-binding regulatory protein
VAGHSHSSNIRFRKDRVDAKRAKTFAKLSRMITVAAKQGGGSIEANARLRLAVDKARVLGMPRDGIDRAIKKGTGDIDLGNFEEIVYEGYGPGGVALMLDILTDNRHRTAADVRMIMEKFGGNLGTSGSVAWMFERRGRFVLDASNEAALPFLGEERLLELALAVGAEDVADDGGRPVILSAATEFAAVQQGLLERNVPLSEAGLAHVPNQRVLVGDVGIASKVVKLVDALEDHDDVQAVFGNEDFPADIVGALEV